MQLTKELKECRSCVDPSEFTSPAVVSNVGATPNGAEQGGSERLEVPEIARNPREMPS